MQSTLSIYTVVEAAERMGLSDSRVRKLCIDHDIGFHKAGARLLTDDDLDRLMAIPRVVGRPRKNRK